MATPERREVPPDSTLMSDWPMRAQPPMPEERPEKRLPRPCEAERETRREVAAGSVGRGGARSGEVARLPDALLAGGAARAVVDHTVDELQREQRLDQPHRGHRDREG